jgi:hypothetical protein
MTRVQTIGALTMKVITLGCATQQHLLDNRQDDLVARFRNQQ